MQKIITGIVIALGIIGVGAFVLGFSNSTSTSTASNTPTSTREATTPQASPVAMISPAQTTQLSSETVTKGSTATHYSHADVKKHSTQSSCWAAINGKVCDLTAWISQHPGGPDKILGICGTDGSAAFNGQHGGQRRPASELANFYIAELTK